MTPAEGPPPSDGRHSQVSANRHGPVPLCMAKKWLPVTHRHGCAIYWHQNVLTAAAGEEEGQQQDQRIGGELMVSCIIKGTPQQCLDALLSSRCGNSILGPATAVEGLQESADGTVKVGVSWTPAVAARGLSVRMVALVLLNEREQNHHTPRKTTGPLIQAAVQERLHYCEMHM